MKGFTDGVAQIIAVDDAGDLRLADYVRLTDARLRTSVEEEHGLFIAEGDKVIRRAIAAGYPVRSLLATAQWAAGLAGLVESLAGPVYVVSQEVAEQLTGYRVHRGPLASMARLALPDVTGVLAGRRGDGTVPALGRDGSRGTVPASARRGSRAGPGQRAGLPQRVIVLEDLVDHGNVGGIFRCAAALGVDAVLLSPRCADPLYRRAIKVSMGAVFAIPYARMTDWRRGLAEIRAAGFRLLALTPDQSALPLGKALTAKPAALLLGTEGDGLSSRWLHEADDRVCIPMSADAIAMGVDSLNVVAAAAIACHELARLPG